MTDLRQAAQQALEAMDSILLTCSLGLGNDGIQIKQYMEAVTASRALRAALAQQAEPQSTHNSECWRWHHKCAVAKIERECKHDHHHH